MEYTTLACNYHTIIIWLEQIWSNLYNWSVWYVWPYWKETTYYNHITINDMSQMNAKKAEYQELLNSVTVQLSDNLYVWWNAVWYITLWWNDKIVLAANWKILRPIINVTGTPTVDVLVVWGGWWWWMWWWGWWDVVEQTGVTISDTTAVTVWQWWIHWNAYRDALTEWWTGWTSSFGSITASWGWWWWVFQNELPPLMEWSELSQIAIADDALVILNQKPAFYFEHYTDDWTMSLPIGDYYDIWNDSKTLPKVWDADESHYWQSWFQYWLDCYIVYNSNANLWYLYRPSARE